jgi:ligand-binding sensor domain-containing protein
MHQFNFLYIFFLLLVVIACTPNPGINETNSTAYGRPESSSFSADPYFVIPVDTFATPDNISRDLLQDKNENIWIASWQGLILYNGKKFTNLTLKKALKHFRFFSIAEDENSNLWFGTIGAGVYFYDEKNFTNYTTASGLANNRVQCILATKDGSMWFGTDGGASHFNRGSFTNFTHENGLCDNAVQALAQDHAGNIWIGTANGICIYNGKTFSDFRLNDSSAFNNVRAIKNDKAGNIWIGSESGLFRYLPDSQVKSLEKISTVFVSYIMEDKKGNLWLSGSDTSYSVPHINLAYHGNDQNRGMALYKYDGKKLSTVVTRNNTNDFQIFRVIEGNNGNIYFGTMKGICRYDGSSISGFNQ